MVSWPRPRLSSRVDRQHVSIPFIAVHVISMETTSIWFVCTIGTWGQLNPGRAVTGRLGDRELYSCHVFVFVRDMSYEVHHVIGSFTSTTSLIVYRWLSWQPRLTPMLSFVREWRRRPSLVIANTTKSRSITQNNVSFDPRCHTR